MIREPAFWLVSLIGASGVVILAYGTPDYSVAFRGPPQMQYELQPPALERAARAGEPAEGETAGRDVSGETDHGAELNPNAAFALDDLAAIRDRPLFSPTRSPPRSEAAPEPEPMNIELTPAPDPPSAAPSPPAVSLVGVIMGDGAREMALLLDRQSGSIERLAGGAVLDDGWTLHILNERSVMLERDGLRHALSMFTDHAREAQQPAQDPPQESAQHPEPDSAVETEDPAPPASEPPESGPETLTNGRDMLGGMAPDPDLAP